MERFIAGLQALGFAVERRGALAVAILDVGPGGIAASQAVGADPPDDFPNVAPHWIHLPGGVRLAGDPGNESELGDGWRKWSRPHPSWKGGTEAGRAWAAHARSLLLGAERHDP